MSMPDKFENDGIYQAEQKEFPSFQFLTGNFSDNIQFELQMSGGDAESVGGGSEVSALKICSNKIYLSDIVYD